MNILNRALLIILFVSAAAVAQEPNEPVDDQEVAMEEASGTSADSDSAQQTMQQMMELRQSAPIVEPVRKNQVEYVPSRVGVPAVSVDVDRSILGVVPGDAQPTLRREGEFVISRRGRLVRSPDGAHVLFVFESDSKDSPEPPMIMQACQWLETMETIIQQRGDAVVFIVTGQIHTYRGANYLLPTMVKQAIDQGNLQN